MRYELLGYVVSRWVERNASTTTASVRSVRAVDTVYRQDTLRLTRTVAQWRERVVQRFDTLSNTVRIPVETVRWVVAQGDSVVTACRSVLLTCEQRVATRDSLIGVLRTQGRIIEQQRPSRFTPWLYAAAGVGVGVLIRR